MGAVFGQRRQLSHQDGAQTTSAEIAEATAGQDPSNPNVQAVQEAAGFRVLIDSCGTRGDQQPLIWFSKCLMTRGHIIHAMVPFDLVDLWKESGVDAVAAYFDHGAVFKMCGGVDADFMKFLMAMGRCTSRWMEDHGQDLAKPSEVIKSFKPDVVVWTVSPDNAEAYEHETGVPAVGVLCSGSFVVHAHVSRLNREPLRPSFVTTSGFIDSPLPRDLVPCLHRTGAWLPPSDGKPEEDSLPELEAFLSGGPPPVAIGWGSMIPKGMSSAEMLMLALQALHAGGRRGVIIGGWARLDQLGVGDAREGEAEGKWSSSGWKEHNSRFNGMFVPDPHLTLDGLPVYKHRQEEIFKLWCTGDGTWRIGLEFWVKYTPTRCFAFAKGNTLRLPESSVWMEHKSMNDSFDEKDFVANPQVQVQSCSATYEKLLEFAKQQCHFVPSVSHKWLFPRCSCVVHHGGAGTTNSALAAGTPAVVTPIAFDQFHWSSRVNSLKAGFGFDGNLSRIMPSDLAAAITKAESCAGAAKLLGDKMRDEGGVEAAAIIFETFLQERTLVTPALPP
mmetsp:Transcript_126590/g.369919  ORF Transcript_126590/g.369919 Transcript_126590/m.369919 type:complete len:557 (+) Transcript_126590:108-1778(+)